MVNIKIMRFKLRIHQIILLGSALILLYYFSATGSTTMEMSSSVEKSSRVLRSLENMMNNPLPASNLQILRDESPDLFQNLPEKHLESYKNHCWYMPENNLKCIPNVFLAGMPKCGTSDLYEKLVMHPHLSHTQGKEPKWWSRNRVFYKEKEHFLEYLNHQIPSKKVSPSHLIIDASTTLLWHHLYWEERYPWSNEPPYTTAGMIHSTIPGAKILVILRDPTERLYSDYLFFTDIDDKSKVSAETFDKEVRMEIAAFENCLGRRSLRDCCYNSQHIDRHVTPVTLALGIYITFIREWKEKFGDNMLILTLNEYATKPLQTLTNVYKFLGLPIMGDFEKQLSKYVKSTVPKNERTMIDRKKGNMLPETLTLLRDYYKLFNEELVKYLDDDKFLFQ